MSSRQRRYWFAHGGRQVFVIAGSPDFAKEKFQARWGYWPADPTKSEPTDPAEPDGGRQVRQ